MMGKYPPGCWETLEDLEDFTDWSKELQALETTKTLRTAVLKLGTLGAQITAVMLPLEMEDYASGDGDEEDDDEGEDEQVAENNEEEGNVEEVEQVVVKEEIDRGPIRVSRRRTTPAQEVAAAGYGEMKPKVRVLLSYTLVLTI
jgi:hypothetical protein